VTVQDWLMVPEKPPSDVYVSEAVLPVVAPAASERLVGAAVMEKPGLLATRDSEFGLETAKLPSPE
jgi:hypothetical protein